jgi:hypothetical protein
MITCQDSKHLFDQYLDGELSPSLQTELHAHQLSCSECQSELALLEACGDVIAFDRREPRLSASFTDRVVFAHRAQYKPVPQRRWGRLMLVCGSPLAAAASIAFAVLFMAPTVKEARPGKVLSGLARPSDNNLKVMMKDGMNPAIQSELNATPAMPGSFVDAFLGEVVDQTRNTVNTTKRSLEQLNSFFSLSFAGANDALAAGGQNAGKDRVAGASPEMSNGEPDLLEPTPLHPSAPSPQPADGTEVDDSVEAL